MAALHTGDGGTVGRVTVVVVVATVVVEAMVVLVVDEVEPPDPFAASAAPPPVPEVRDDPSARVDDVPVTPGSVANVPPTRDSPPSIVVVVVPVGVFTATVLGRPAP